MKKIRSCIEYLCHRAKTGKEDGKYSVHSDEVYLLESMGFIVKKPKNYHEGKNLWEVRISWKEPSFDGSIASRFKKLVAKYRQKYNDMSKSKSILAHRQAKKNFQEFL